MAGGAARGTGTIAFYGEILNPIDSHNPLLVRPGTVLLAEDGSVALVRLKWSGWGTKVARATGVLSASSCDPSCATGRRTERPARLVLSNPGIVDGHRVYRCYRVSPHRLHGGPFEHGCIRRQGKLIWYASDPMR